jgi:predicted patatin/cPLA2 family phospholipase
MKKRVNRVLVLDGGGMQGAFMAGILNEFNTKGIKPDFFDSYIATSAGAYNAAYYITGQMEEGLRIWKQHLPNGFIKKKRLIPKTDLEYLKKVITKIEPLDLAKLKASKQKLYITLSDPVNFKARLVCLNKAKNPVSALLAGTAMPFFSHFKVYNHKRYYDGGLISQPPLEFAKKLNPKEIWVLLTYPKGYRLNKLIYKIAGKFFSQTKAESQLFSACPDLQNPVLDEIEKSEKYKVIRPSKFLPVNWINNDINKIAQTVKLGERAANKFLCKLGKMNY